MSGGSTIGPNARIVTASPDAIEARGTPERATAAAPDVAANRAARPLIMASASIGGLLTRLAIDNLVTASVAARDATVATLGFDADAIPEVGPGSRDKATITLLQGQLNVWLKRVGKTPVGTAGEFGPYTQQVIRNFQRSNGLVETGRADRATWQALGRANLPHPVVAEKLPSKGPAAFDPAAMPTLRAGATNTASVKAATRALNAWRASRNRPPIKEDGVFGPALVAGVTAFQKSFGLPPTGVIGPETWAKLAEVSSRDLSRSGGPKSLGVPWINQYDKSGRVNSPGGDACFRTCYAMVVEHLASRGPKATFDTLANKIDVGRTESATGEVKATRAAADASRAYIDRSLDAGLPLIVGISHKPYAHYNENPVTDHYVVLTGRGVDESGRTFYTYNDPFPSTRELGTGRFYVNADGKLEKPGKPAAPNLWDRRWQVSEVRTWAELR